MSDVVDIANDLVQLQIQQAEDGRTRYRGASASHCTDCDEPIPEGRRRAIPGTKRCTSCASEVETWRSLGY